MGMKLSMCVSVRADLEVMQQRQAVLGGSEFLCPSSHSDKVAFAFRKF